MRKDRITCVECYRYHELMCKRKTIPRTSQEVIKVLDAGKKVCDREV